MNRFSLVTNAPPKYVNMSSFTDETLSHICCSETTVMIKNEWRAELCFVWISAPSSSTVIFVLRSLPFILLLLIFCCFRKWTTSQRHRCTTTRLNPTLLHFMCFVLLVVCWCLLGHRFGPDWRTNDGILYSCSSEDNPSLRLRLRLLLLKTTDYVPMRSSETFLHREMFD